MSEPNYSLGSLEERVLMAVGFLNGEGYGTSIRQAIEEATGRGIAVGALYSTLDRLERKGLLVSWQGEPTPERSGRPKRYFRITAPGEQALEAAEAARQKLRVVRQEGFSPA